MMINMIIIMINDKADEIVKEIFEWFFSKYQIGLETSMKGSNFNFDYIDLLYWKSHKVNIKRSGSYIDSPDWI